MRIAVDSGGTFTDCVYVDEGQLKVLKLFSTPQQPSHAVLDGILKVTHEGARLEVRHGTTVGTNAMLERRGARVAYVTTAGFADVIAIGRQTRPSLYDWFRSPLPCIVPPSLRFGVEERTSAEGEILRSPTSENLARLRERIRESGAESIALSLLFSFANPLNERLVTQALEPLGLPISVSHKILPEFREYERGSTVVINAYLAPKVGGYIRELERSLTERFPASTVQVMQSSGGIVSASLSAREPVRTVLSGPAGGVIGAYQIACIAGFTKLIGFDMGGTSTDVSVMDAAEGGPKTTNESVISELPISVPMLDIHTVGAGGGSLARFDEGGILHVGPQSAGAIPGPICYGHGQQQATVTDANLILGRLDPDLFLGGEVHLDNGRTREIMERTRSSLASVEQYAAGIIVLAETAMEKAIRVISIERGYDPRDFTLVSFGGAGPLHACSLAKSLHIPRVLVPCMPGALSALGILMADVVRDYSKTVMMPADPQQLEPYFAELEERGTKDLASEGLTGEGLRSADLRYIGQGYELNVPAGANILDNFHYAHSKRYGYSDTAKAVEVVNIRVRLTAKTGHIELPRQDARAGDGSQAVLKTRDIRFAGEWRQSKVYQRDLLISGDSFAGPALITEYSSTTVLPPDCRLCVDEYANLVIEVN
jgi:N-methylhydantoinase A